MKQSERMLALAKLSVGQVVEFSVATLILMLYYME